MLPAYPGVLEFLCHDFKLAEKRNESCLKNLILTKCWTPCEMVKTWPERMRSNTPAKATH